MLWHASIICFQYYVAKCITLVYTLTFTQTHTTERIAHTHLMCVRIRAAKIFHTVNELNDVKLMPKVVNLNETVFLLVYRFQMAMKWIICCIFMHRRHFFLSPRKVRFSFMKTKYWILQTKITIFRIFFECWHAKLWNDSVLVCNSCTYIDTYDDYSHLIW